MLKIVYMPSDFHPLVLVHTDKIGLSKVIRALGNIASVQAAETFLVSEGANAVRLIIQNDSAEVRLRIHGETLYWQLTAALASYYTSELTAFLKRDEPSGSVILEQGVLNEIPVKVTIGEFDDTFFE